MNGTEKVIKHLEMIQAVINRFRAQQFLGQKLEHNSYCRSDGFDCQTGHTNPIFCLGAYSSRPRVLDSGWILSLAGKVVSTSIRRNQSSIRYQFRDESYEAQK